MITFFAALLILMLPQVDIIRTVTLPHLQLFGVSDGLELRVSEMARTILCQILMMFTR